MGKYETGVSKAKWWRMDSRGELEEEVAVGGEDSTGTTSGLRSSLRFSTDVVDRDEAELLELIRAYLLVSVVTGTVTSMVCHLTGKCRPMYIWMIAVSILPAWALMVFLFPLLPYVVLALLISAFYEAGYYLMLYWSGNLAGVEPVTIRGTSHAHKTCHK